MSNSNAVARTRLSLYRDTCHRRLRFSDPNARINELRILFARRERAFNARWRAAFAR